MVEYIDRESVMNLVDRGFLVGNGNYNKVKKWINEIPAADVHPAEYGEWTAEGNDEYGNYWDECTACRKSVWFPPFVKNDYKYCPHCGAKMDGEE